MIRQIRCECGYVARSPEEDEVIVLVLRHVAADHPELVERDTPEYLRDWIELVPE